MVGGYSVGKYPRRCASDRFHARFIWRYGDMTVQEYLDFFGACYHIPPTQRLGLINDLLELVDIAHRR
jgi:ABC-2 type transport system ATP-binding protein